MQTLLKFSKYLVVLFIIGLVLLFVSVKYFKDLTPLEIEDLESIEFYNDREELFFELSNNQRKSWVKLEDISDNIIESFITVEDKNFYHHNGFDYKRIVKAFIDNIKTSSRSYGASTITQQYARNLYLSHEKSWNRKIKEAYYAFLIERKYDKDEILEGYLNTIYFGHGIYGVSDASKFYFDKSVDKLSIAESAILAAIPKSPLYYSPINDYERNNTRKELIIDLMVEQKKITSFEGLEAKNEVINIIGKHPKINPEYAPFFQDVVINELDSLGFLNNIYSTGLKVYTTLDSDLHNIASKYVRSLISDDSDIEIALYAIEPSTGHVKAVIGGRDYQVSQYNRATSAARHPGSTIKPLLYYSALEYGFTPTTTFSSTKTTFYLEDGKVKYSPKNFADIYANKDITMAYALAVSDNMYAVKTHLFLGEQTLVEMSKRVGITTEMMPLPSLALGSSEVHLDELTTSYAYFANYGEKVTPTYITKVTDSEGNVLYEPEVERVQVLDPDLCFILSNMLTGMFDTRMSEHISVTGLSISHMLSNKYSGKSGSTDYDNWMIGYNPDIVIGVWAGYDDMIPIEKYDDKRYSKIIWANVIEEYMESKDPNRFEPTDNVVAVIVDPINGNIADKYTNYSKPLYFKKGTEPHK